MMRQTYQPEWDAMSFPVRLQDLRKSAHLTQQQLAEKVDLSTMQIRRYEAGKAQPTLDVIKRLAQALSVSTDHLIFEPDERGPSADLILEFEKISRFNEEEKRIVKGVLKGLILKHEADSL